MKIGRLRIELNISWEPSLNKDIKKLLKGGHRLFAIKLYKDKTGVGLKEAVEYIDNILTCDLELNKQFHESRNNLINNLR